MDSKTRILVADAGEEFRRLIVEALAADGSMEVAAETGDGEEAVRLAGELRPDVVVLDLVLSSMDGLEVLGELAALPERPRLLVLSSFARGNVAELAGAPRAD